MRSHYAGPKPGGIFDSKGQKLGNKPCGKCVAQMSSMPRISLILQVPNNIGSHIQSIAAHEELYTLLHARLGEAMEETDDNQLKTIPKHFKEHHSSDPTQWKVRGIDSPRGGDWKRSLHQRERQKGFLHSRL